MAAVATSMDVPESQRLIAVSLGKIAASRGQKGGINLHKNLLVATVLHKARTAYMIQHINAVKQRAAAPVVSSPPSSSAPPTCAEMKEQKVASQQPSATTPTATSSPSSSVPVSPSHHSSQRVAPETASVPESAAGSCMQVAEIEDKENTPPAPSPPSFTSSVSLECEKRLHGDVDSVKEQTVKVSQPSVNHREYKSSSSCCLLKRRRAMDSDHENVSAPKVRIVESKVTDSACVSTATSHSACSNPEPMQCDSPQISNLVNIFNTSFSGLSGPSSPSNSCGDMSVRNVGQSILSSHKLSENLTCAKEMKVGLDSLHQPLVLSV